MEFADIVLFFTVIFVMFLWQKRQARPLTGNPFSKRSYRRGKHIARNEREVMLCEEVAAQLGIKVIRVYHPCCAIYLEIVDKHDRFPRRLKRKILLAAKERIVPQS